MGRKVSVLDHIFRLVVISFSILLLASCVIGSWLNGPFYMT